MFKHIVVTEVVGIPVGALLSFVFGSWTPLLGVLLVLIGVDIITGIAKGFYKKSLRSRTMSQGMIRKAMIFFVIILANMIDVAMFDNVPVAKTGAVLFYIAQEGLSIIENLAQMDTPLPEFIKKYLLVIKERSETTSENGKDV